MDPRRKNEQAARSTIRPSRHARVPQRPATPLQRSSTATPQLPKASVEPAKAIIPLLDASDKTPKRKMPRLPKKVLVALCLLLIAGYFGTQVFKKDGETAVKGAGIPTGPAVLSRDETPKFDTVLPAGKTIEDYGGWTRVSPPDREPVFAYVDKIGDIPINVSQQPLPKELQEDTDERISQLSHDFRAEEKFKAGGTTVHIGTSAKGPQSLIFTKNGLLILIKSAVKIDNDKWDTYISSLQ